MDNKMDRNFDYNLIKILSAVIETGSASKAGEMLNMSNSSVSYAINKLRDYYSDPIFIRQGLGVQPTTLALNLYRLLKPTEDAISEALELKNGDSSVNTNRTIKIRTNTLIEFWLSSHLLSSSAPANDYIYEFISHPDNEDDRLTLLRNQQVDIDIGLRIEGDKAVTSYPLFPIKFVVVCRKDHPRINKEITFEEWQKEVNYGWTKAKNTSIIQGLDNYIQIDNVERRYRSQSLLNILLQVALSDAVMVMPQFLMPFYCKNLPVTYYECDFLSGEMPHIYAHVHHKKRNITPLMSIIDLLTEKN